MKIRKGLIGISAIAAVATVTLVSCGGSKKYNVNIEGAVAGVSFGDAATNYKVKNSAALLEQLNAVKPTKTGYTFAGWYLDAACKTKLTAETKIKDVKDDSGKYVVYAGFTINKYTVTFDYSGTNQGDVAGTGETSVGVNYKGKVEAQPVVTPAKRADGAEYSFVGWYKDANRTEVFDFENTEITANTTIYAKWDIAVIDSADAFLAYVNAKQEVNAVITADIDLTGKKIDRTKATLQEIEGALNTAGSDYAISLSKKVFGNGHKIINAEVESDVKLGAIWSGCNDGAIYDLVFEDAKVKTAKENGALIFGQVDGKSAVIQDIVIDGLRYSVANGGKNIGAVIGQVKNAVDISIDGLVIRDSIIKQDDGNTNKADHLAGVIGLFNSAAGEVRVTDLIIDGLSIEASDSSQRAFMVFGQAKGDKEVSISLENAVIKGSTSGLKATAVVGECQSNTISYNLKNISVVDFNSVNPQNSDVALFVLITKDTYQPAALNMTNCKYRSWGVNLQGKDGTSGEMKKINPTQGEAVDAIANLAALGDNISYSVNPETHVGAYVIEINGVTYSAEVAKDPTVVNLDDKSVEFTSSSSFTKRTSVSGTFDGFTYDTNTMARVSSTTVPYVSAAEAGKAGNAFDVTLTPNATITAHDLTGAYIVSSDLYKPTMDANGVITGKIYFTNEEIATIKSEVADITTDYKMVKKDITVCWFDNANEVATNVTYSVIFQNDNSIDFRTAPVAGAIAKSTTDANASLTAAVDTTDNKKLKVTAGQIDWATDGNYVEVTVAKASGINGDVTTDGITVTGATKVSYTADVLTAKVKITAKGDKTFTVKWNAAADAITYTINVANDVTLETSGSAPVVVSSVMLKADDATAGSVSNGGTYLSNSVMTLQGVGNAGVIVASNATVTENNGTKTFTKACILTKTNSADIYFKLASSSAATVKIYYTMVDSSFGESNQAASKSGNIVVNGTADESISGNKSGTTAYVKEIEVAANSETTIRSSANRLAIFAIEYTLA